MEREVVAYPDPVLTRGTKKITEITPEIRSLAEDMAETMYAKDGVGLAATQVGESWRLAVVDVSGPKERSSLILLVNPEIIETSGEVDSEERCLSVPGFQAKFKRAAKVKVKAQDLDGKEFVIDAEDLLAICLQHEIDHLDGRLILDRSSRLKRSLYDKKIQKWLKRKKRSG
ncbi:MAG: peptide deformylase [Thermodesulfobacteriota bacterium]|nr:peptide deformylase [Thermodesulfobacteriota bacterium]